MRSKELLKVRKKFEKALKRKEIVDIVLFGSAVKGKEFFRDIDLAVIHLEEKLYEDFKKKLIKNVEDSENFHISFLSVKEFFKGVPLSNILLREGYSLKYNKPFSEVFRFSSKVLFSYSLEGLNDSKKVRIVNYLRGRKNEKGIIEKFGGVWISRNVFLISINFEKLIEEFFISNKVKFKKWYCLIH